MTNDKTEYTSADMYGASHHLGEELPWSSTDPIVSFLFPLRGISVANARTCQDFAYEQETYSNTSREEEENQGA